MTNLSRVGNTSRFDKEREKWSRWIKYRENTTLRISHSSQVLDLTQPDLDVLPFQEQDHGDTLWVKMLVIPSHSHAITTSCWYLLQGWQTSGHLYHISRPDCWLAAVLFIAGSTLIVFFRYVQAKQCWANAGLYAWCLAYIPCQWWISPAGTLHHKIRQAIGVEWAFPCKVHIF